MDKADIPYDLLDPNIVALVRTLNMFEGLRTVGSCGGHENPGAGQWPPGEWVITFKADHTEEGWFALEFLTWAIQDYHPSRPGGRHLVRLSLNAFPPYLNTPGEVLCFYLHGLKDAEGFTSDPDELATWIAQVKEEAYISPAALARQDAAEARENAAEAQENNKIAWAKVE